MKLEIPTAVSVVVSAIAGVIVAFFASEVIVLEPEWKDGLTVGLTILAGWGISPLTGAAFRALLHLSNVASAIITGVLGSLQIILTQVSMSAGLHGLLAGVIAFAAGLGFGPSISVARARQIVAMGVLMALAVVVLLV